MEAIFVIVGIASLVFIVISAITYINLVALSKAELQRLESAVPGQENEWAQGNEFEYVGRWNKRRDMGMAADGQADVLLQIFSAGRYDVTNRS